MPILTSILQELQETLLWSMAKRQYMTKNKEMEFWVNTMQLCSQIAWRRKWLLQVEESAVKGEDYLNEKHLVNQS